MIFKFKLKPKIEVKFDYFYNNNLILLMNIFLFHHNAVM